MGDKKGPDWVGVPIAFLFRSAQLGHKARERENGNVVCVFLDLSYISQWSASRIISWLRQILQVVSKMARRVIESHHGHLLIIIESQSYVLLSKIVKWKMERAPFQSLDSLHSQPRATCYWPRPLGRSSLCHHYFDHHCHHCHHDRRQHHLHHHDACCLPKPLGRPVFGEQFPVWKLYCSLSLYQRDTGSSPSGTLIQQ